MKAIHKLIFVSVVAVVLTAGITYLWMEKSLSEKQEEIVGLEERVADRGEVISSLEGEIENTKKFWRLLLRAVDEDLGDACLNMGFGRSDYDDFSYYYDEGFYEDAGYFADGVDGLLC